MKEKNKLISHAMPLHWSSQKYVLLSQWGFPFRQIYTMGIHFIDIRQASSHFPAENKFFFRNLNFLDSCLYPQLDLRSCTHPSLSQFIPKCVNNLSFIVWLAKSLSLLSEYSVWDQNAVFPSCIAYRSSLFSSHNWVVRLLSESVTMLMVLL